MNYKTKKIVDALNQNKEQIILFLLGYLFFVLDTNFVTHTSTILKNISITSFFASYAFFIFLSFFTLKVFLKKIKYFKYERKPLKIFHLISMGSFVGFLTNIINAHVNTTFERFLY